MEDNCIGGDAQYNATGWFSYCECYRMYAGNDCGDHYKDVVAFLPISLVISAIHFALLLYLAWIAFLECCSRAWKTKQTTRTLVAITAFGRLLMLLISPSYGILAPSPNAPLDALFLLWPAVFVLLAALNSILHWHELTRQSLPVRKNARQSMDSVRSPSASTRGAIAVTSPSPNNTGGSGGSGGTATMGSTSGGKRQHTYTMVVVSTNAASLLKYVAPRPTRIRGVVWTTGFFIVTILSWLPGISGVGMMVMRVYLCVWFAEVSASFALIVNKLGRVAAEIRGSHQYHRRSLQKAIRLSYIWISLSILFIAATIIEVTNIGEWLWLACIAIQRSTELALLTTFIWALETDSSYAPRAERMKVRGPIGRDAPDPPPERDLYKDRENDATTNGNNGGNGSNGSDRERDREAQRAYNDRYKSSGVVNSGGIVSEPGAPGTSGYGGHTNHTHGHHHINGHNGHHSNGRGHGHNNKDNHHHKPTGNTFVTGGHSLAVSVNQEWVPHPSLASPGGSGFYDHRFNFRAPNVKGGGATQLNNELHDSGLLTAANVHNGALAIGMPNIVSHDGGIDATNTHMSSVEGQPTLTGSNGDMMTRRSATYTMTVTAASSHPYAIPDQVPSSLLQIPSSAA